MNAEKRTNAHFFTGNYAPLTEEHDIAALDIEGTLPPGLSGSLYRVGPSPQYAPRDDSYHWFSGDGMVHAFHIGKGRVSYRNRWARTPKWQLEHEAGRALFGTFGNPATSDPLVQGRNGGTANTSMLWHGGRLFALEESHQPFELDAFTLASKGHQSFGDRHKAFFRYSLNDNRLSEPGGTPALGMADSFTRGQNYTASITSNLKPTVLNEFRFNLLYGFIRPLLSRAMQKEIEEEIGDSDETDSGETPQTKGGP